MFCRNCSHLLLHHRDYKCPECGMPFDPADPDSFLTHLLDPWRAVRREAVGAVFQIFGLGHRYAGKREDGLLFMAGWWVVAALLLLFGAGPLVLLGAWGVTAVISCALAARTATRPETTKH